MSLPLERIHRFSALARPLDPAWRTNRWVMGLIPLGAGLATAREVLRPSLDGPGPLATAALGGLGTLGTWALAREVAPDRHGAAFLALGLGLVPLLIWPGAGVLVVFTAMLGARMVARSTGLAARVPDAAVVLGLFAWTAFATGTRGALLVGALAFVADALLPDPAAPRRRSLAARQAAFAVVALALFGLLAPERATRPLPLGPLPLAAVLAVSLLHVLATRDLRTVRAPADATGAPLLPVRVWAGAWVALLLPLFLVLLVGEAAIPTTALAGASLAGAGTATIVGRLAGGR